MKNWKNKRTIQNTPKPNAIFLPKTVSIISDAEVKHRSPIKKTVKAMKNVCVVIICRFIKLKDDNSFFQLKYFGKNTCIRAKKINSVPIIFK